MLRTALNDAVDDVKLIAPALEALINQEQYTFLNDDEIFQNQRTGKRWNGDHANTGGMETWIKTLQGKIPQAISHPAYVCQHDAHCRRTPNVGSQANGTL